MAMIVMLNLPPETEQLLKAARAGQTLEVYLKELAEREAHAVNGTSPVGGNLPPSHLPPDEWIAQWYAWAERQLPRAVVVDDSRESIYAGRGE
jgi:hypothetical protein